MIEYDKLLKVDLPHVSSKVKYKINAQFIKDIPPTLDKQLGFNSEYFKLRKNTVWLKDPSKQQIYSLFVMMCEPPREPILSCPQFPPLPS